MKRFLFILLLLGAALSADAQVIKGSGILYFRDTANVVADTMGTELSYVIAEKQLYYWDRDSLAWFQLTTPDVGLTQEEVEDIVGAMAVGGTQTRITITYDDALGVLNVTAAVPDWNDLVNVPAGFADGVDNVDDADADPTNELNTSLSLSGDTLYLTDPGGTLAQDLSSLTPDVSGFATLTALQDTASAIRADFPVDTDDQTAAEVPITDGKAYYVGTDVEAALGEVADTLTKHRADIDVKDPSITNELITATTFTDTDTLTITEAGTDTKVNVPRIIPAANRAAVLSLSPKTGARIKLEDNGAEYVVQADTVAGYATDSVAVIPTGAGTYAVLSPSNRSVNTSHFGITSGAGIPHSVRVENAVKWERLLTYAVLRNYAVLVDDDFECFLPEYVLSEGNGLTIQGNGGRKKIDIFPKHFTGELNGRYEFLDLEGRVNVVIENLEIAGPRTNRAQVYSAILRSGGSSVIEIPDTIPVFSGFWGSLEVGDYLYYDGYETIAGNRGTISSIDSTNRTITLSAAIAGITDNFFTDWTRIAYSFPVDTPEDTIAAYSQNAYFNADNFSTTLINQIRTASDTTDAKKSHISIRDSKLKYSGTQLSLSSTNTILSIVNTDFDSCASVAFSFFPQFAIKHTQKFQDVRFHANGTRVTLDYLTYTAGNILGSSIYVHPNLPIELENVKITNYIALPFRQFSSSGTKPAYVNAKTVFRNVEIYDPTSPERGLILASDLPTYIYDSKIDAPQLGNSTYFVNSEIYGESSFTGNNDPDYDSESSFIISYDNCDIYGGIKTQTDSWGADAYKYISIVVKDSRIHEESSSTYLFTFHDVRTMDIINTDIFLDGTGFLNPAPSDDSCVVNIINSNIYDLNETESSQIIGIAYSTFYPMKINVENSVFLPESFRAINSAPSYYGLVNFTNSRVGNFRSVGMYDSWETARYKLLTSLSSGRIFGSNTSSIIRQFIGAECGNKKYYTKVSGSIKGLMFISPGSTNNLLTEYHSAETYNEEVSVTFESAATLITSDSTLLSNITGSGEKTIPVDAGQTLFFKPVPKMITSTPYLDTITIATLAGATLSADGSNGTYPGGVYFVPEKGATLVAPNFSTALAPDFTIKHDSVVGRVSPFADIEYLKFTNAQTGEIKIIGYVADTIYYSGIWKVVSGDTDDQTAAEVPITDAGAYYTGTDVEAALGEIADTLTILRTDLSAVAAGASDGVATSGAYDNINDEIDVTVAAPGTNFSIDVSALAEDADVTAEIADTAAVLRGLIPDLSGFATQTALQDTSAAIRADFPVPATPYVSVENGTAEAFDTLDFTVNQSILSTPLYLQDTTVGSNRRVVVGYDMSLIDANEGVDEGNFIEYYTGAISRRATVDTLLGFDTLQLVGNTLRASLRNDGDPTYEVDLSGLTANETITLTGDVTGSGTTSITTTIATGAVGADELASTAVTPGSYTAADITVDADGRITAAANGTGGGGVSGSGTANFLPRWTAATTLGNSVIQDNGTRIGIGVAPGSDFVTISGNYPFSAGSPLKIINTSTNTFTPSWVSLMPNMDVGDFHYFQLGKSVTTNNAVTGEFMYTASGSNSNRFSMKFHPDNYFLTATAGNKNAIGPTTTPQSTLDIEGNLAVGASYSGTTAAPANGAIIQGRLGIGTTDPGLYQLSVVNNAANVTARVQNLLNTSFSGFDVFNDVNKRAGFGIGNSAAPVNANEAYFSVISPIPFIIETNDDARMYFDSTETKIGIGNLSPAYALDIGTTDGIKIPAGTTAQRPTNAAGVVRWNSTDGVLETGDGTNWLQYSPNINEPTEHIQLISGGSFDSLIVTGTTNYATVKGWGVGGFSTTNYTPSDTSAIWSGANDMRTKVDYNITFSVYDLDTATEYVETVVYVNTGLYNASRASLSPHTSGAPYRYTLTGSLMVELDTNQEVKLAIGGFSGGIKVINAQVNCTNLSY